MRPLGPPTLEIAHILATEKNDARHRLSYPLLLFGSNEANRHGPQQRGQYLGPRGTKGAV